MKAQAWLALALIATAGCLGSSEPSSLDDTGGETSALPAPVHDQRRVEAGASPVDSTQDSSCENEASTCYRYPFEVGTDARVQAHLDWTNRTNDFDLHVVDPEGQRVASASTGPLDTSEELDADLSPGSYELVVVAWLVSSDTYTLEAHFGYA